MKTLLPSADIGLGNVGLIRVPRPHRPLPNGATNGAGRSAHSSITVEMNSAFPVRAS
jgi:hypothetical protein